MVEDPTETRAFDSFFLLIPILFGQGAYPYRPTNFKKYRRSLYVIVKTLRLSTIKRNRWTAETLKP